ncbi:MAG: carboxypeptidase regulatory-like domain-containing protein, partial [Bacteroidetes bacterium]|nr:carboxypeptidase regulatory-like domain-containing protein [Bacteroidota bacterium]
YDCNVLGDPALQVWTDQPVTQVVTHPDCISVSATSYTASVDTTGKKGKGLRAAILQNNKVITSTSIDSTGQFTLNLVTGQLVEGTATLVISGYNTLPDTHTLTVFGTNNVSSPGTTADNGRVTVNWTNPAGCYDEIMIVAKPGSTVSGSPSGNGTAYTASAAYGGGTAFNGGFVVSKWTASPVTVTGLTNGSTYYFRLFTRTGTVWSSGTEVDATPAGPATTFWTGTVSASWDNPSNWSNGVPSSSNEITINPGDNNPVVTVNHNCQALTINAGASLTVNPGVHLTVTGNTFLNNPEALILKSDETGTASFIDNGSISGTGTARVEQYLTGTGNPPGGRYYYVGPPVTSATSGVYDAAGINRLWYWDEAAQGYTGISDNSTSLAVQHGYVTRLGSNTTCQYTGTPNTGNKTITGLTRTGTTSEKRGFHLVSNVYPSGLDWDLAERTNILPTLWFRTVNGGGTMLFDTYNADSHVGTNNNGIEPVTGFIRPMQACWVRVAADGDTGSISFTNAMRTHTMVAAQKSPEEESHILRISVNANGNTDETIVLFSENAADAFESWDSEKMFTSQPSLPEIYSTVPGQKPLVINSLSPLQEPRSIQLGFSSIQAGTFSISANTTAFEPGTSVILEDLVTGTQTDLRISPYPFSSQAINTATRFVLHLSPSVITGQVVYDNPAKTPLNNVTVELLDSLNQLLLTGQTDPSGFYRFTGISPGTYHVRASSAAPAGGINAVDALAVIRHFTGLSVLTDLKLLAGDTDASGYVNAIDALLIQKRFVELISSFTAGNWKFEEKTIVLTTPGTTRTCNINGLCTGDVNASFIP